MRRVRFGLCFSLAVFLPLGCGAEATNTATEPTHSVRQAVFTPSGNSVVMEAESFDAHVSQGNHSWSSETASGASSGVALRATPDNGAANNTGYTTNSPRLDYQVQFAQAGTYQVWIRGRAGGSSTADSDSLHVGLDGAAVASADRISSFNSGFAWSRSTMDGANATLSVPSAGLHTVNVWMREDGFVFDKILLTTDSGFTPTGTGPAETPTSGGGGCSGATYEAENMSNTTGGSTSGGWNIWSNGSIYTTHSFDGSPTTITVTAQGQQAVNVWPHMIVRVGGVVVGDVDVNATSWTQYTFAATPSAGSREIRVEFDNDYYDQAAGNDRNLLVDKVVVACAGGPTCADAAMNGDETDVDCGGGTCEPCSDGLGCGVAPDCESGVCTTGTCQAPSCSDGVDNGTETDTDCGGSCSGCVDGQSCSVGSDCQSGTCTAGVCETPPACDDGLHNGTETDTDCGGSCDGCDDGLACNVDGDCLNGWCDAGLCATPPTCSDGIANGSETDTDCGGSCSACADGQSCGVAGDCQSGYCDAAVCGPAPTCTDGVANGAETDTDCGGPCAACTVGQGCGVATDCDTGVCTGNVCQVATCTDGIQNGTETGLDCGAGCPQCPTGQGCTSGSDCLSLVCAASLCQAPTCTDGIANGTETDSDCGGGCPACADGATCASGVDCVSGVCSGATCSVASCSDGVANGTETDTDCGGACGGCADGQLCLQDVDCQSGFCSGVVCVPPPACDDGQQNGGETGVDCGGPDCPACPDLTYVWLEAESGVLSGNPGFTIGSDGAASGGQYIEPTSNNPNSPGPNRARYTFTVDAGTYVLWGRVVAPNADDDSFWVSVDGGTFVKWNSIPGSGSNWVWDDVHDSDAGSAVMQYTLAAGVHTIDVANRENGPRLDKLYLTSEGDTPSGMGGADLCNDGILNQGESDVDCGGPCTACDDGFGCGVDSDCASGACESSACVSCGDGIVNQDETDVDCGGSCAACPNGASCVGDGDCASGTCASGICIVVASCSDGQQNQDETDVDCGGSCDPCSDGDSCSVDGDCSSGLCDADDTCVSCSDGEQNGSETGTDCGGPDCSACGNVTALFLEAESGVLSGNPTFSVGSNASASGGQYISPTSTNTGSPGPNRATYTFTVGAGTYVVWGRVAAPSADDDSFWVSVDGGSFVKWNSIPGSGSSFVWSTVHDSDNGSVQMSYTLGAGTHTLVIANREDGVQLDRLYVTANGDSPTGGGTGANWVDGTLVTFNDNGQWCWYQDERVVVDASGGKIVLSSDANSSGAGGSPRNGDIDVVIYDIASGATNRTVMRKMNPDDHNAGALLVRPDGQYLAMYAGHNENYMSYYRIYNGSSWGSEGSFNWQNIPGGTDYTATYSNLFYLSAENRVYNFVRSDARSPNMMISNNLGASWSYGGRLTSPQQSVGYVNGYFKYWGNGVDRIDFVATEHHPRDYNTSIFHGYVRGGQTFNSFGQVMDSNITDKNAPQVAQFTRVFASGTQVAGVSMTKAWTTDLVTYADGTIATVFKARANNADTDHRHLYARFDGSSWRTTYLGRAGDKLYSSEQDYTGLAAVHPDHPEIIYVSTPYDPRDGAQLGVHEIFRGTTCDDGVSFTWEPVTANSSEDNLRPVVPKWDATHTALLWARGTYNTAQIYDMAIVGIVDQNEAGPICP